MRFTAIPIAGVILFSGTLLVVGCGSPGFKSKAGAGDVLRYALATDVTTLDPAKVQDVETMDLLANVFECLVSYDEKNELVGQLAESWKVSPDGKTYTFTLRKGALFHNLRSVTAEDVRFSLERACSKELASPTAGNYLSDIVGVSDFIKGSEKSVKGLKVVDEHTIEIKIDRPRAYFLGKLTYPCAAVLCKEAIGNSAITQAGQTIGTGPFQIEKIAPTQKVTLKRFEKYYDGVAKLATIERPIILDAATRMSKYRAGELDLLTVQRQDLVGLERDQQLAAQLQYIDRPAVYYIGFNQGKSPVLKNEKVRQAIAMAIDRKSIVVDLLNNLPEAHGLIAPGVLGYRADYKGITFDPTKAKQLLAEAGFPEGKGFPELPIAFREQTPDTRIAVEAIDSQLRTNLGIKVKPTMMQWGSLLKARNGGELTIYMNSWFADYADPQNFLSFLFTSDSKLNHDGFADPKFDALCNEADESLDPAKRKVLYQKAESQLVDSAVRIPLYYGRDAQLVSPRVSGIRKNILGIMPHLKTTLK